jgi:outer membrane autotransporter protein
MGLHVFVSVLALLGCGVSGAQQAPGPLDVFLDRSDLDTDLQFSAGTAIQATCLELVDAGGASIPDPQQRDLFFRCQEVVHTAGDSNTGGTGNFPRSLGYTDQQLVNTIQQYAGEEITALGDLATRAPSGQFANIAGRLNALRLGTAISGARARTASLDYSSSRDREAYSAAPQEDFVPRALQSGLLPYQSLLSAAEAQDASTSQPADAPIAASPWGWFLEANYNFGDRDATDNEDGFEFDAYSTTLGIDYSFDSGIIGASIGYDNYSADFEVRGLAVTGGEAKVKGGSASVFVVFFGENVSFNAIGSYGEPDSDVTRNVIYEPSSSCADCGTTQELSGSPGTRYLSFGATLAFNATLGSWDLTPSLSLSVRNADVDGYTEENSANSGGLALAFEDQSIDSNRSIVAVDLSRAISRNFGILTPSFRAEWHHEFEDEARSLSARFAFAPNDGIDGNGNCYACFGFVTDTPDRDFGVVGAGLAFLFPSRFQAYMYAETLLGARDFNSTSIGLGLRGQF